MPLIRWSDPSDCFFNIYSKQQKVPVNTTLYGGNQHKAELTITVPSHHTTTTLAAARHIDITYVLSVKALMGTGLPLIMDLPVIISNWPRYVNLL